jgi:hypothetical protein
MFQRTGTESETENRNNRNFGSVWLGSVRFSVFSKNMPRLMWREGLTTTAAATSRAAAAARLGPRGAGPRAPAAQVGARAFRSDFASLAAAAAAARAGRKLTQQRSATSLLARFLRFKTEKPK